MRDLSFHRRGQAMKNRAFLVTRRISIAMNQESTIKRSQMLIIKIIEKPEGTKSTLGSLAE